MSCFYHNHKEDTAVCPQCGKKLCNDCASITVEGICYNCAINNNQNVKKAFFTDLAILFVLLAVAITGIVMFTIGGDLESIGFGLILLAGFIPSWKTLTNIANKLFGVRVYSGAFLIFAILFKIILAAILSAFMPFWYLIKFFINLFAFLKIKKNIQLIEANYQAVMNKN